MQLGGIVAAGLDGHTGLRVEPYGSFVSGLYSPSGDLDISIEGFFGRECAPALRDNCCQREEFTKAGGRIAVLMCEGLQHTTSVQPLIIEEDDMCTCWVAENIGRPGVLEV